jgi:hypothetical protein
VPARFDSSPFIVPAGFDPRWSLLGRVLRHRMGDRLRAEALHIALSTGGALVWLMGVYAADALAAGLGAAPLVVWGVLGASGLLLVLGSLVGVRPRAVVTCGPAAVHVERGRERLRLAYAALEHVETVEAGVYHRHYRRYATTRPFLNGPGGPVLLLRAQATNRHTRTTTGLVVALGLPDAQREALRRRLEAHRERREPPALGALEASRA